MEKIYVLYKGYQYDYGATILKAYRSREEAELAAKALKDEDDLQHYAMVNPSRLAAIRHYLKYGEMDFHRFCGNECMCRDRYYECLDKEGYLSHMSSDLYFSVEDVELV